MKNYKSTISSLVTDEMFIWFLCAENEEEAFDKSYEHWQNLNYVDHGTMDLEEIEESEVLL